MAPQMFAFQLGTRRIRSAGLPEPRLIGRVDATTMPVVVALQRQSDGSVNMIVGEEAEELEGTQDTEVIHNIKRWALSSDPYVNWRMSASDAPQESWWNRELNCVEVWGQRFQPKELVAAVLHESVRRAHLPDDFEWRAGCPVHAGYEYRSMLKEVLADIAGRGSVNWVIDEPVLFLAAAQRNIAPDSVARTTRFLHGLRSGGRFLRLHTCRDSRKQ